VPVWAVLAAAGSGERLGGDQPKAFVRLGELPLLAESLSRLDQSDWVDQIVVAAPPGWEEPAILLTEEIGCSKCVACVTGGATRAESVRLALGEVPEEATVVLVHDAARPLVSEYVIERVLTALGEGWDGVVPALPVPDTVKRVERERVVETLERAELVTVQTPQAFAADVLRRAVEAGGDGPDCASLVERAGGRIRWVQGDRRLLKVTTPADLELVASWL
jgi:2-C-methyl-D-erythritol 4-phosphate cytidylyltransferase